MPCCHDSFACVDLFLFWYGYELNIYAHVLWIHYRRLIHFWQIQWRTWLLYYLPILRRCQNHGLLDPCFYSSSEVFLRPARALKVLVWRDNWCFDGIAASGVALVGMETAHPLLFLGSYFVDCRHWLVAFRLVHWGVVVSTLPLLNFFEVYFEICVKLLLLSQAFLFCWALFQLWSKLNCRGDLHVGEFDRLALRLQAFWRLLVREFRLRRFFTSRIRYRLCLWRWLNIGWLSIAIVLWKPAMPAQLAFWPRWNEAVYFLKFVGKLWTLNLHS